MWSGRLSLFTARKGEERRGKGRQGVQRPGMVVWRDDGGGLGSKTGSGARQSSDQAGGVGSACHLPVPSPSSAGNINNPPTSMR